MVSVTLVLTVNPGSSSLQLHVVRTDTNQIVAAEQSSEKADRSSAARALDEVLQDLDEPVAAVGHRLVHGGQHLRSPSVVTEKVIEQAREAAALAPEHVPVTLEILDVARDRLPDVPHVLCPDTAFHSDLPELAATYAIPAQWREQFGLRRYGFHGLSYAWATKRAAELLDRREDSLNLLLAHLGGGCSVCAVRGGSSVDTSMGFTPLDGVPMATRSGSVDPGMLLWLLGRMPLSEVSDGLYHRSGLFGLSDGRSADTRDLVKAANQGDTTARCALDIFTRRISQALAAMSVTLPYIDALVFTGEIGWDQPEVRQAVCQDLTRLGVPAALPAGNPTRDRVLSSEFAPILVMAVQPREELQIARETAQAI